MSVEGRGCLPLETPAIVVWRLVVLDAWTRRCSQWWWDSQSVAAAPFCVAADRPLSRVGGGMTFVWTCVIEPVSGGDDALKDGEDQRAGEHLCLCVGGMGLPVQNKIAFLRGLAFSGMF